MNENVLVNLHGDGSDLDGEALTFQWTQISGDAVSPSGSGQDVSFTANYSRRRPNASLELGFRLTVMDSCGGTTTADKTVHVVNIAHDPTAIATVVGSADSQRRRGQCAAGRQHEQRSGSRSAYLRLDAMWRTRGQLVYSPGDTDHIMPMFVTPWVSAYRLEVQADSERPMGGTSSAYVTVTVILASWTPPDAS